MVQFFQLVFVLVFRTIIPVGCPQPTAADASFTFRWADYCIDGDIYSFYTKGEAAPYGRLNRVYTGIYA
jgi:hypothetical protein